MQGGVNYIKWIEEANENIWILMPKSGDTFFVLNICCLLEFLSTYWRHLFGRIHFLLNFFYALLAFKKERKKKKETKFESIYNIIKIVWIPHSIVAEFIWDGISTILQRGKQGYGHRFRVKPMSCSLQVTVEAGNFQSNQKVHEDIWFGLNILIFKSLKSHL